jgi:hypothetical protein
VQGRDALLRVFLTADEDNELRPSVRATFYNGASVVHQVEMTSAATSIPLAVQEGLLSLSWNAMIPGSVLQPGTSVVIEADPENAIALKPGSRSRIPAVGTFALDVRAVPPLWLRMVPIIQAEKGTTGNISEANLPQYLQAARSKFPIAQVNVDIRSAYITFATASTSTGWTDILYELRALRVTENSGRYYYGVLRHPGGANIGGLGFIGHPAAVGYDHAEEGPETFAHEIGHNFNLLHAPCGGPADADPQFPYAGGGIGHFGYDLFTGQVKLPSVEKDLMTYCGPEWISDFSYVKALNYRESVDWTLTGPRTIQDAILVWGGVANGQLILEPTFRLDMLPQLPSGIGPYQIRGLDASGAEIFSYRFDADEIDHLGGQSFAFAIPNRVAQADRLAEIVLNGPEGQLRRRRSGQAPAPAVRAFRPDGVEREVAWDAVDSPMALVRDSQTGQVISFARGGRFSMPGRVVDVITSDGVNSTTRTIDLR